MDESLRRGIIRAILALGALFIVALIWLASLPPPIAGWELEVLRAKARDLDLRNNPTAAAEAYRELIEVDPTADNRKGLARALLREGKPEEASRTLATPPEGPTDEEWAWLQSRASLQAGDSTHAAEALARAGSYRENHPIEPEPSPYVGAERCASCHQQNHKAQQSSAHARTFARAEGLGDLALPDGPITDPFDPNVNHTLSRTEKGIRLETRHGNDLLQSIAQYAFGSGDRGLTLVGEDSTGQDREFRISKYAPPHGWQLTSGQTREPRAKADYLGRPLGDRDLRGCFACHTTQPDAAIANSGPTAKDHAIGCEQCHGPGGNHLRAVEAKLRDLAIARARGGAGGGVQELCARCHNPKEPISNISDPATRLAAQSSKDQVRFQSATFPKSRCVTESRGAFDCLTCHDPHKNAETDAAFYEAKCLGCHTPGRPGSKTVCRVNPSKDCVGCHMPPVSTAVPHSTFTDHQIRIHPLDAPPELLRRPGRAR